MKTVLFTIATIVLLNGCATWSTSNVDHASPDGAITTGGRSPAAVELFYDDITRPYRSLGEITVNVKKTTVFNADPTREQVNEKLKEQAAALGADAVILVRYGEVRVAALSWGSLEGRGRAIKFSGTVQEHEAQLQAERAQREAQKAKEQAEALALQRDFDASKAAAVFRCGDKLQCDKAFSLTQIFIATNSDMKIQLATDTLIETYNPNKEGAMGAMAMKLPLEGSAAEIRLLVTCRAEKLKSMVENCKRDSIKMNLAFAQFLREKLLN